MRQLEQRLELAQQELERLSLQQRQQEESYQKLEAEMQQQEAREQEERQHRVEMRLQQQQQHQQATAAAAALAAANQAAQAAQVAASAARSLMPSGAAYDLPWYQFMADDGSQPGVGAWFGLAAGVRAQQQRPTYVLSGLADVVPPIRLSARLARAQRSAKGAVSVALRRRWRRQG
jgi:hypothetical protein